MVDIGVVVGIGVAAATGARAGATDVVAMDAATPEGMGAEVTGAAMPVTMLAAATDTATPVAADSTAEAPFGVAEDFTVVAVEDSTVVAEDSTVAVAAASTAAADTAADTGNEEVR